MAVAFIGGTLIPVIVCLLLVYVAFYRDRGHDPIRKYSDRTWHNRSTKSVHSSPSGSDKTSDYDLLNPNSKRRLYDRTYRTHEPIKGKPLVDFTGKEENLRNVSQEDLDKFNDVAFGESGATEKSDQIRDFSENSPNDSKTDDESSIADHGRNESVRYNELSSESYEDTDSESPVQKDVRKKSADHPGELESLYARRSGSSKSSAESYKSAAQVTSSLEVPHSNQLLKQSSSGTDSDRIKEINLQNPRSRKSKNRSRPTSTVVQTAI